MPSAPSRSTAAGTRASGYVPIADYGLLSDCSRPRSSAATARSTGSACRASTARASSRGCSIPPPATGRSRPSRPFTTRAALPARLARDRDDVHDRAAERCVLTDALAVRGGPARPRARARRAARAAAARRGRRRRGRAGAGARAARRVRARAAAVPRRAWRRPHVRRAEPARRARRRRNDDRGRHDARPLHRSRAGEQAGFSLRWAPVEGAQPEPTAPRRRRRADRRHRRGVALLGGRALRSTRVLTWSRCGSPRAC